MAATLKLETPRQTFGGSVELTPYEKGAGLPVFIAPRDPMLKRDIGTALAWMAEHRDAIDALVIAAGGVVFRGFPFPDTAAFNRVVDPYPDVPYGYSGGATTRGNIAGRAFEATRAPPDFRLMLHQEMAYLPNWPTRLAFYCAHAPETGGETIIGDVRRFEKAIDPKFVQTVHERGVKYVRNFRSPDWIPPHPTLVPLHKTWQEAFFTDDPRKAEADCKDMGLDFEWTTNGSMSVIYAASGFTNHAVEGREVWFNHIASQTITDYNYGADRVALFREYYGDLTPWTYQTYFADGGKIPLEDVEALYEVLEDFTVAFPWRAGDVMLLDNIYSFHGRNAYTGTRDVQVALIG